MILLMMVISVFHKHFAIPVHVAPFIVKQSTNGSLVVSLTALVVIGLVSVVTTVTTGLVMVVTVVVIGRTTVSAVVVVALVILVVRRVNGVMIGVVSLHAVLRVPLMRLVNVLKMTLKCVSGLLAGTRV